MKGSVSVSIQSVLVFFGPVLCVTEKALFSVDLWLVMVKIENNLFILLIVMIVAGICYRTIF